MFEHFVIIFMACVIVYFAWRLFLKKTKCYRLTIALAETQSELDVTYKRLWEIVEENRQIIIGRDEQEENYEMQFLTFQENIREKDHVIELQDDEILELEARLEQHDRECLPILNETRWQALSGLVEGA